MTIKDGVLQKATLRIDDKGTPTVAYFEPVTATPKMRRAFEIAANGTLVEIRTLPTVTIHQMEKLREQLSRHYMLRRVMADPQREVHLHYSKVVAGSSTTTLAYSEPLFDEVLLDEPLGLSTDAAARIVVKRATVPLESPDESPLADGGLLIGSDTAVFDHQLFRYDGTDGAECLFGEVSVPSLTDLLRRDEPILSATRDGLVWSQETLKELKVAIESEAWRHCRGRAAPTG